MKRNELEVGAEYVVLAPSQRDKVDDRYAPNVKRVRVLDTEPVWVKRYSGGFRDDAPTKQIAGFDSDGSVDARDRTAAVRDSDYRAKDAKSYVRCLVSDEHRNSFRDERWYTIEAVSTSMLAMPWAAYAERRAAAKARAEAADKARNDAADVKRVRMVDAERRKVSLNASLIGTGLTARIVDGEVGIFGAPQDLIDIATRAQDALDEANA